MKKRRKNLKQALSFVLAGAMIFSLMPVVPNATVYASDTGSVSNTGILSNTSSVTNTRSISKTVSVSNTSNEASEQTTLDISKGDITIGDSSVNGYDESGNAVTSIADVKEESTFTVTVWDGKIEGVVTRLEKTEH